MTARQIAQELAQARRDLDTLEREADACKRANDEAQEAVWRRRIADMHDHIREEAFHLSEKEWMPQPHKTLWAALRLLDISRY